MSEQLGSGKFCFVGGVTVGREDDATRRACCRYYGLPDDAPWQKIDEEAASHGHDAPSIPKSYLTLSE